MYPWVTHTWNPIRGCRHNCIYCYVQSIHNYDMTPRYVQRCLSDNLGEGKTIFVCSTGDMFGEWVPDLWISSVLSYCHRFPHNTYLFQTKNPQRIKGGLSLLPMHTILGTTLETNRDYPEISIAPPPDERANWMYRYSYELKCDIMLSIEPIIDFDLKPFLAMIERIHPKFVSVGADSKGHNLPEPDPQKVQELVRELQQITEVKFKRNLARLGLR